jgi:hypothetical protein
MDKTTTAKPKSHKHSTSITFQWRIQKIANIRERHNLIEFILLSISCFVIPSIAPLKYIFSLPVSSGWNPVPTSSRLATRPLRITSPSVGCVIRERILSNVDLTYLHRFGR